jgi:hypothetical protein
MRPEWHCIYQIRAAGCSKAGEDPLDPRMLTPYDIPGVSAFWQANGVYAEKIDKTFRTDAQLRIKWYLTLSNCKLGFIFASSLTTTRNLFELNIY